MFLARWTLHQFDHPWVHMLPKLLVYMFICFSYALATEKPILEPFLPLLWQNPTLEYYTNYKASDLKTIVHALQAVQLNSDKCPLHAVRDKYQQNKVRVMFKDFSSSFLLYIIFAHSVSSFSWWFYSSKMSLLCFPQNFQMHCSSKHECHLQFLGSFLALLFFSSVKRWKFCSLASFYCWVKTSVQQNFDR